MDDGQIIELYWQRNSAAITESNHKYGAYCFAIADNILCSRQDAEECVNDTWFQTWNAIPPHRPMQLKLFLARIVRNLSFNRYHARNAEKRGSGEIELVLDELEQCLTGESDVERDYEAKELEELIRQFTRDLPQRDGNVFVRRYFFTETVSVIAKRYGMTENHVMVVLSRTRKKLKAYLAKEGYFHE